jgi:UDP-2,4-diacetamido-2,4,6-trideoxy-beta-L-altropyranose hydrolase
VNAIILTEGGKGIGFGHIARCGAIYDALTEKGVKAELIVNGDDTIIDLMKGRQHRIFNWLKEQNTAYNLIKRFDIVVLDSYKAKIGFYNVISEVAKTPIYIDDTNRMSYPAGIVLNGAVGAEKIGYARDNSITYLLGGRYAPLRREFWESPVKKVSNKINNVMMAFGGDDARNLTPKVLKSLSSAACLARKRIIIGDAYTNAEEIERCRDDHTNLIYRPDAKKIKEIMMGSDIAISGGGQTLYELARVGVPTVAIATADNQMSNIEGLRSERFIEYAGRWDAANIADNIKTLFKKMEDANIRKKKRDIGRGLIDGKGALRVADHILFKK